MLVERVLYPRLFQPERGYPRTPADAGLPSEEVHFTSEDGTLLTGWLIPGQGPLVLWSHGNGGNIAHRLPQAALLHHHLGVTLFLYDYRGFGTSEGTPTEHGTYADARAALRTLQERLGVSCSDIVLFGQSLGAAVTAHVAARCRPRAVILEAAFTSVADIARHMYPWLPVWPLLRGIYDAEAEVVRIEAPLLLIHGNLDDVVPVRMARRLFDAAAPPKRLRIIAGGGHGDLHLVGGDRYLTILREVLEDTGTAAPVTAEG